MTRRKNGEVEWTTLGELGLDESIANIEIGIRHHGPGLVREWGFRLESIRHAELKRIVKEREGLTPEVAPEFFDGLKKKNDDGKDVVVVEGLRDAKGHVRIRTPEGYRAVLEFAGEVVSECTAGIRGGSDIDGEKDTKKIAAEITRLGAAEAVMNFAMGVQSLTKAERFPSANPGDV